MKIVKQNSVVDKLTGSFKTGPCSGSKKQGGQQARSVENLCQGSPLTFRDSRLRVTQGINFKKLKFCETCRLVLQL